MKLHHNSHPEEECKPSPTSGEPLVIGVVVCRDSLRHLSYCLPSLRATEYGNFRIVIVDNASSDGTCNFVRQWFPDITILRLRSNRGYTGGMNAGIEHATSEGAKYVALLNPDILVHPAWLQVSVRLLEENCSLGVVGFEQIGDGLATREPPPNNEIPLPSRLRARRSSSLWPACMVAPTSLLHDLGGFDEGFRSFGEESDLFIRAARAGYHLATVNLPFWHFQGSYWIDHKFVCSFRCMCSMLRLGIKHWPAREFVGRFGRLAGLIAGPRVELDKAYSFHQLIHAEAVPIRWVLFAIAIVWNIFHLPETLRSRRRDLRSGSKQRPYQGWW